MIANFSVSDHFTYYELTNSKNHPELLAANRDYFSEEPYLSRLEIFSESILEPIRFEVGGKVIVNSCGRYPELNKAVGGSETSQHRFEMPGPGAADIYAPSLSIEKLFELIEKRAGICWHQLRVYPDKGFIHISMPTGKNDGQVKIVLDTIPVWFLDHND
jgi:hypothetical protein